MRGVCVSGRLNRAFAALLLLALTIALLIPAPSVRGQSSILSDAFNRADGAMGVADTGQTWVSVNGFHALIDANRLSATTSSVEAIDPGVANYIACVTFITVPDGAAMNVHQENANTVNGIAARVVSGTWRVYEGATELATTGVTAAVNDRVCMSVDGSAYALNINGSPAASISNSAHASDRHISFIGYSQFYVDDLDVVEIVPPTATPTATLTPTTGPSATPSLTPTEEILVTSTPTPVISPTPVDIDAAMADVVETGHNILALLAFGTLALVGIAALQFVRMRV